MLKAGTLCLLACSLAMTLTSGAVAAESVPSGAKTVMDNGTYLRFHVTRRKTRNITPKYLRKYDRRHYSMFDGDPQKTPPPAGWTGADFDDNSWPRNRPEWLGRATRHHTSIFSLRGKFNVTDPAAVTGLFLELKYRGGVAVYFNGKEVARGHLPAGKLSPETEAEKYPDEAWLSAGGTPLPSATKTKSADDKARKAKRARSLGPVKLPAGALRKGVNVLALELRRSPYNSKVQQPWFKRIKGRGGHYYSIWKTIGLVDIKLRATGSGIEPNLPRPAGIQVWTPDVHDRLSALDYGDPTEKPLIRIVGARNGSFGGQISLGAAKAFGGVKAVAGELKAVKGSGKIPASRVKILYGAPNRSSSSVPYFDGLLEKAPKQAAEQTRTTLVMQGKRKTYKKTPCGATQLVYVRVDVPKNAAPGEYRGEVAVSASGLEPVKVPLELHVADWTLPDPQQFRTFISLYQSPTSVALEYNVKMWSEEHWKLLEKSWELLGRAGNKICNVHAIERTQFGNERAMIHFLENGAGGYKHDFSIFDRYVKLARKHCGKLEHVGVQVLISRSMKPRPADQECKVTVRDEAGGLKSVQIPVMGTEASKKFWKPMIHEAHKRLGKLGLADALCLGSFSDDKGLAGPNRAFDEIWPGGGPAKWWRGGHISAGGIKPYPAAGGAGRIVFHEHCYGMTPVTPIVKFPPIWDYRRMKNPGVAFFRDSSVKVMPLLGMRVEVLRGVACRKKGMGRIGLDFWRVLKGRGSTRMWIYNRYPNSYVAARCPYQGALSWPGPDGAEPTVRFESYLEGIQEVEALMVLSEAADKHAAKIGADLAEKCREVIRECLWRMEKAWEYCDYDITQKGSRGVRFHGNHYGWQATTRRLYDCAAEVARKLGK